MRQEIIENFTAKVAEFAEIRQGIIENFTAENAEFAEKKQGIIENFYRPPKKMADLRLEGREKLWQDQTCQRHEIFIEQK
ncbi:MAG: hypothetical protein WC139_13700 [Candidatus Kapaibacterium sp.]